MSSIMSENEADAIDIVESRLDEFGEMRFKYKGDLGKVIVHALSRLEQIADVLDQQETQ